MNDEPDLLFLLHDLARQLRADADRRAAAYGMTRTQWVILFWIDRQPGLSQKALAELLEVEPITVARLIDRLAERGMIERRDDPADRRIWRLHICPPALPVLEHLRTEREDMLRMATAELDPSAIGTIREGLMLMKNNVLASQRAKALERDLA